MASRLANTWKKTKNIPKNWWKNSVEDAPPAMRDLIIAYAPLERVITQNPKTGKVIKSVPVGSYVPELKVLAKSGELKAQIEEKKWIKARKRAGKGTSIKDLRSERLDLATALYWPNGKRKTPFQLSIVPSFNKGPVQKVMEREYKFRRDHQLPLPQLMSKYRVGPDCLRDIGKAGLVQKGFPVGFKINIKNPAKTMTLREKLFHYTGQWASLLLTITGALAIGITNPWLLAAGATAMYFATKTGKDFSLFDVAETFYRDLGCLMSKKLGRTGKWSLGNIAKMGVYLAALAFAGFLAVSGAWTGAFALPCWSWLAASGMGLAAVETFQLAAAGILSLLAAACTYSAVTYPVRYFCGLTIYDNQEHPTKAEVKSLPQINVKKDLQSALDRKCLEVVAKIAKPKYNLSSNDRIKLTQAVFTKFDSLHVQAGRAEKAANDHKDQIKKKRRFGA